jgi:hypothetical protein
MTNTNKNINIRILATKLIFYSIIILTISYIARDASASHLGISNIDDQSICAVGLTADTQPVTWNLSSPISREYVEEAKHRNFSLRQCARLSGRFSENEVRRIPNSKSRKPKSIFNQTKTMAAEIKVLKRELSRIGKELAVVQTNANKQATLLSKKQVSLTGNTVDKIRKLELDFKKIDAIKGANDANSIQVEEWRDLIPKMVRSIKQLELSARETSTNSQELLSLQQVKVAELAQKINSLQQTRKISKVTGPAPQSQEALEGSGFVISNYLPWMIPMVLLLGAFGVIIIVLLRKNNETKSQLEGSMRYANKNKKPPVDDKEKPDSE